MLSEYSNFVSKLYTSQHQCSNVQTYVIENLDLQILYRFQSNLSTKLYHADLVCFQYFCILLVQSKHNINIKVNIKTTLYSNVFKLLCYFRLTKLKEARQLVMRWPYLIYCQEIVSNSSWYQSNNEHINNICANISSVKNCPIRAIYSAMQFKIWMKEILIFHQHYFNWHY